LLQSNRECKDYSKSKVGRLFETQRICRLGCGLGLAEKKHKFNRIRQVASMCRHGRARWRNRGNTIESSVCGGDAALCQITLTTC